MNIEHPRYPDGSPILMGDWISSTATGLTGTVVGFGRNTDTVKMVLDENGDDLWIHMDIASKANGDERAAIEAALSRIKRQTETEIDGVRHRFPGWVISGGASWAIAIERRKDAV